MTKDNTALEWVDMTNLVETLREAEAAGSPVRATRPDPVPPPASPHVEQLLQSLPRPLQLYEIRLKHPHLVERIASAWKDPRRFAQLMDDLVMTSRPDRQGFSFGVLTELANLRDYYFNELHPAFEKPALYELR